MFRFPVRVIFALLLLLALRAAAQSPAPAPGLSPQRAAAVDAAVQALMRKDGAIGVAVGVVEGGKAVYLNGYGFADRERALPVTLSSSFRWASVSKPVTAVAAMQLVEQGALKLDEDVRKYVPEFPDKGETITIRQLLCHQGGIVHYTNGPVIRTRREYPEPHPFQSVILALDTFKESPLVCKPGEKYSYTTHGYILLSAAVERAGRRAFLEQVQNRICKPAGLASLQPDYPWISIPGRVEGYFKSNETITRRPDNDVSWTLGGGGFTSNIQDLTGFVVGLANRRFVSRAIEAQMWEAQRLSNGMPTTYGLGFGVGKNQGRLHVSHSGAQKKTRTQFLLYPGEQRGVAVMTNSEWVQPAEYARGIMEALR